MYTFTIMSLVSNYFVFINKTSTFTIIRSMVDYFRNVVTKVYE